MRATEQRPTATGCYVYGIAPNDGRARLDGVVGVGAAPVSLVAEGSLAAVVADVARDDLAPDRLEEGDTAWLESAVRAHEDVLERCLAAGPVLPMRFATTFRTASEVRALLRERQGEYETLLEHVRGRHEWGVKAFLTPAVLSSWLRSTHGVGAETAEAAAPGAAYLAAKRAERELAAAGEDAVAARLALAHDRLARIAVESRLLAPTRRRTGERERVRLNAAYLVADSDLDALEAALESLSREHAALGLRYERTGPWPPYNFVALGSAGRE